MRSPFFQNSGRAAYRATTAQGRICLPVITVRSALRPPRPAALTLHLQATGNAQGQAALRPRHRAIPVWADTGADSNYVLAGSQFGGLFKTADGGKHWQCITDNAPLFNGVMGVTHIAVNPLNNNTIYLSITGGGILESYNGGGTWAVETISTNPTAIVTNVFYTDLQIDFHIIAPIPQKKLFSSFGAMKMTQRVDFQFI
jgi:hypothetical protein